HVLAWALMRRLPPRARRRFDRLAGIFPSYIDRLAHNSFKRMHHGLSRIGIVSYDMLSGTQVVCHSERPVLSLEDSMRGPAPVPGLFGTWRCRTGGRKYRLVDGGTRNLLPVEVLLDPPFRPVQILAIDVSRKPFQRREHLARVEALRQKHPRIPIDIVCVDTLDGPSVVYSTSYQKHLLDLGHRAAREYLERGVDPVPVTTPAPVVDL